MKTMPGISLCGTILIFGAAFLLLSAKEGSGQVAGPEPALASLDKRRPGRPVAVTLSPERRNAAAALLARAPDLEIDYDDITGSPSSISSPSRFLTGPDNQQEVLPRDIGMVPNQTEHDPYRAIKAFLDQNIGLFEHGPELVTNSLVVREFTTPHNGMRTIAWQQQVDGIPVFGAFLIGHVTRRGELVSISSCFLPRVQTAAGLDDTSRVALEASPPISARGAVVNAATNIGETLTVDLVTAVDPSPAGPDQRQRFSADVLAGEAQSRLVWMPMSRASIRLSWEVQLTRRDSVETFRVVVDAETGDVVVRDSLSGNLSQATYLVFTSDSPSPYSPGNQTPSSYQPPASASNRNLVSLASLSKVASPKGWINDGNNETLGNNADAHLDRDFDFQADLPRPNGGTNSDGSAKRDFHPPLDLSVSDPPLTYGDAGVVNAFYWCNWFHDRVYELGFTEAAGNFQTDNFGRGGLGNDAVQVDVQQGRTYYQGLFNGSGYTFGAEGSPLRVQFRVFNGPTPDRDSALDSEVVIHELTHGLSQRHVGAGQPFTTTQA
jgi:hypothetical protein